MLRWVSFIGLGLTALYAKLKGISQREFMDGPGGPIVWILSGLFVASVFLFLPISAHLTEKDAGIEHLPPSKPFKIIAGIGILIFVLIAIGVWATFLLDR